MCKRRYTHKTSGFKTSGFKTSGFKTSETSGLQNVRSSKRPVAKKHPSIFCTCGWWKSAGSVSACRYGCLSLSSWMSQLVVFLIFNYIITFLLYTNRSIPQCGCSELQPFYYVSLLSLNFCTLFFLFQFFRNHILKAIGPPLGLNK